jgi:Zn-dependent peptidase ImmA (M78 family)
MLVVKGERGAIGYNSAHARVRQRFTISHEIAHLCCVKNYVVYTVLRKAEDHMRSFDTT